MDIGVGLDGLSDHQKISVKLLLGLENVILLQELLLLKVKELPLVYV